MYIAVKTVVKEICIQSKKKKKKRKEIKGVEAVAWYDVVLWGGAIQPLCVFYR